MFEKFRTADCRFIGCLTLTRNVLSRNDVKVTKTFDSVQNSPHTWPPEMHNKDEVFDTLFSHEVALPEFQISFLLVDKEISGLTVNYVFTAIGAGR